MNHFSIKSKVKDLFMAIISLVLISLSFLCGYNITKLYKSKLKEFHVIIENKLYSYVDELEKIISTEK